MVYSLLMSFLLYFVVVVVDILLSLVSRFLRHHV